MSTELKCRKDRFEIIFDFLEVEDYVGSVKTNIILTAENPAYKIKAIRKNVWLGYIELNNFEVDLLNSETAILKDMKHWSILELKQVNHFTEIALNPQKEDTLNYTIEVNLKIAVCSTFMTLLSTAFREYPKWW